MGEAQNNRKTLSRSLQALHASASSPHNALPSVPPELLEYVENGRNPDIYTREFVELVRRGNQLMRGKARAFAAFRDVLAADVAATMPELRDDVARVLDATGGALEPAPATAPSSRAAGNGAATDASSPHPSPADARPRDPAAAAG